MTSPFWQQICFHTTFLWWFYHILTSFVINYYTDTQQHRMYLLRVGYMDGTVSRTVKEVRDDLIKLTKLYNSITTDLFLTLLPTSLFRLFFFIIITNHTDHSITDWSYVVNKMQYTFYQSSVQVTRSTCQLHVNICMCISMSTGYWWPSCLLKNKENSIC